LHNLNLDNVIPNLNLKSQIYTLEKDLTRDHLCSSGLEIWFFWTTVISYVVPYADSWMAASSALLLYRVL
jgi:hypothetical protein